VTLERQRDIAHRGKALPRLFGHQASHQRIDCLGNRGGRTARPGRWNRILDVLHQESEAARVGIGTFAGQHLEQHAAQRVLIGARVDRDLLRLLGRDVGRRSDDAAARRRELASHAGRRSRGLAIDRLVRRGGRDGVRRIFGDSEVDDLDEVGLAVVRGDEHVGRLQISMDDPLVVDGLQTVRDLCGEAAGALDGEATALDDAIERVALQVFHHQIRSPLGQHAEVDDVNGVGMVDLGCQLGFEEKALLVDLGSLLQQHLHGKQVVEHDMASQEDHAHAALRQALENLVTLPQRSPDKLIA
jgi:hypothetical protein